MTTSVEIGDGWPLHVQGLFFLEDSFSLHELMRDILGPAMHG